MPTAFLLFDSNNCLWCFESASGSLVKRSLDGTETARFLVAVPESFTTGGFDGSLAIDSSKRIFVTAGKSGTVHRVNSAGDSEIFVSGLLNPTGIVFGESDELFIFEAGRSRLLLLQKKASS